MSGSSPDQSHTTPRLTKLLKLECYRAQGEKIESQRVVVAEDDAGFASMLGLTLRKLGHEVVAQPATGNDAVKEVLDHQPDLVIMDINMPGMDGAAASEAILAQFSVPILISTGRADMEALQKIRRLNLHGYLVKPYSRDQLQAAIVLALAHHRAQIASEVEMDELRKEVGLSRVVEYAQELLQRRFGMNADEALEKIRNDSHAAGLTMVQAAERILAVLRTLSGSAK